MKHRWIRPYAAGRGRWLVIAWELGGLAFVGWTTIRLFDLGPRPAALLAGALAVLWLVGSWRIIRIGVYLNEHGVRVRGLVGSRTLPWTQIESFSLDQVIHRLGQFELPAETTVRIRCRDGRLVKTPLWAQGIDFHSRPGAFRDAYHALRERHLAAQAAT
jgi:PH (Pleckstrin Homology) domain-containing protein